MKIIFMESLLFIAIGIAGMFIGSFLGYMARQSIARKRIGSIEAVLKQKIEDARHKEEQIMAQAKEKASHMIESAKKEQDARHSQLLKIEDRLLKKEEMLDRRHEDYDRNQKDLEQKIDKVKAIKAEIEALKQEQAVVLEKISGLTKSEAKTELMKGVEKESQQDLVLALKKLEQEKQDKLDEKAKEIITVSLQRYARSHVADVTTSAVDLPNEELKGKIIGREGRNIRAIERATGVEIIVDDTPGAITLSSFDPVRREIAKLALLKLIADGRIQPARIEEKVEEAREEIGKKIIEAGEEAAHEVGIYDLPKPIIQLLGRLNYRTSYGQNVLVHSIEAAHVAGMMASELGANVEIAKKGALLHDIGKAIDHEVTGSHVELGRRILQKYSIAQDVIKAMEGHHEDYPFATSEAYIVAAAEAMSAARPGARRDTVENYIKRLEELERLASEFEGVEKVYALQAGREVRVFVVPNKVDDLAALKLAKDIATRIESDLKYPGEIKVNVIRELRAVEYAR